MVVNGGNGSYHVVPANRTEYLGIILKSCQTRASAARKLGKTLASSGFSYNLDTHSGRAGEAIARQLNTYLTPAAIRCAKFGPAE
jgi:hypothetical protein